MGEAGTKNLINPSIQCHITFNIQVHLTLGNVVCTATHQSAGASAANHETLARVNKYVN